MKKFLLAISICFILLAMGGTALAQGGGAGWFDFVTDVRLHGQVKILNDLVIDDDLTVSDTISQTWIATSERSAITVDESTTITPTGTYQRITSTRNAGTSSITGPTEGRRLTLINIGSNTITLTDTGTLKLSGNAALGQYDAIQLLADGTNWIQIAPESDN